VFLHNPGMCHHTSHLCSDNFTGIRRMSPEVECDSEIHCGPENTCHFILEHNFHVSWWIFTLLVPMETGMNTLHRSYKIYNFTLTVSTLPQPDKTKAT